MTAPIPADSSSFAECRTAPDRDRECSVAPSRRRFVQTLTAGSSLLLAGCGQLGSGLGGPGGGPTSTAPPDDSPQVGEQTFRAPTASDPAKTSFYRGGNTLKNTAYATVAKEPVSYSLRRFLRQPGVWINGPYVAPDPDAGIQYTWIKEPIEITPTEVTVTARDSAAWSDGHLITGLDLALRPLEQTMRQYISPPAYAPGSQSEPQYALGAFDDFEIGDRSVTYRSSSGAFKNFYDRTIALWLAPVFPSLSPTHIAPFDTYADAVIKTARRAQAGEIYPWYDRDFGDPHQTTLVKKHLADSQYVRKFTEPNNVLATGAWDLVAFDGPEFVFEPNPHHRHADRINVETLRLAYTPSTQRRRVAVKDDRLDFGELGTTPQTVTDAFPDSIELLRTPAKGTHSGMELGVNLDHPAIGQRSVRQAIMYALDQTAIANNVHQSLTESVTTPGGDCWDATQYASQALIDNGFITYTHDRDRAASLMQSAGYTRAGGQWVDANDEALTLALPTPTDTPRWEPTIASQLSAFGIDTTVRPMAGRAFGDRLKRGEFAIWPSTFATAASSAPNTLFIWQRAANNPDKYGIYPDAQFKSGEFSKNGVPLPRTEDRYRVFTIEAAPVGQPDGSLQDYHPASLVLAFQTNPPQAEFRRRIKIGMWLANWYLPTIPISKQYKQRFIDAANWQWPTETAIWKSFVDGDAGLPKEVLGKLPIRANPDNPETATNQNDVET